MRDQNSSILLSEKVDGSGIPVVKAGGLLSFMYVVKNFHILL